MSEATYYRVDTRMWDDADFIAANDFNRNLWQLLLTGPQRTALPGLQRTGMATLAETLRRPLETVLDGFKWWVERGKVSFDESVRVIWIPNAPKYNDAESPNQIRAWWNRWKEIPDCSSKFSHVEWLKKYARLQKDTHREAWQQTFLTIPEGLMKPSAIPTPSSPGGPAEPPPARARADSDSDIDSGRDSKGSTEGDGGKTEVRHESVKEAARRGYAEGIRTVIDGPPFRILDAEIAVILDVIDGTPKWVGLRGSMLADAIRKSAHDYALAHRDVPNAAKFERGFSPTKWAEWLRSGGGAPEPRRPGGPGPARAVQPAAGVTWQPAEKI